MALWISLEKTAAPEKKHAQLGTAEGLLDSLSCPMDWLPREE